MDGEAQRSPLPPRIENRVQVDNALRALQQKKPIPEIDFTLHTMEDGSQVSTMERVCKGILPLSTPPVLSAPMTA
jgi:serine/threonine-protein phosphatase 2B catalytic subunit